jgi:prefoldin alpha subunit
MDQQKIMQIQMMEQEGQQLNEQLQLIDRNITEMGELKESLSEIEKGEDEILTNLGKGIYLPVEIKDRNLIVEVGRGNYVKKNIKDTEQIVDSQILKLTEGKGQIMTRLNDIQTEMQGLVMEFQKSQMSAGAGDNECGCSEGECKDEGGEGCGDDDCGCADK